MPNTLKQIFVQQLHNQNLKQFARFLQMSCSFLFTGSCMFISQQQGRDTRWQCGADIHFRALSKWTNWKEAKRPYFDNWNQSCDIGLLLGPPALTKEGANHFALHEYHITPVQKRTILWWFLQNIMCVSRNVERRSVALWVESQKWSVYHMQGCGHGPPLHLVANREE